MRCQPFFMRSRTVASLLAILALAGAISLVVFRNSGPSISPHQVFHPNKDNEQETAQNFKGLTACSIPREKSEFQTPVIQETAIPFGAKLPAVFFDMGGSNETAGSKHLLLSMEQEFQEEYMTGVQRGVPDIDAWEMARTKSDECYRTLFGQTAYLEALNASAEEADADWQSTDVANQP